MAPMKAKSVLTEHKEHSKRFEQACMQVHALTHDLAAAKAALREADAKDYAKVIDLKDGIMALKEQMRKVRAENDELEYLTNAGDILFKYFETYEGGGGNGGGGSDVMSAAQGSGANGASILSFFSKPNGIGCMNSAEAMAAAQAAQANNPTTRGGLYEKYMELVDKNYVRCFPEDVDACEHCGCMDRQLVSNEGLIYCKQCHNAERLIMEVEKPSYKEPPSEVTYYAYKRMNHCNEWINQIQGKEYTEIPNEVIDAILVELKKQKITNMAKLTAEKVREILRKIRINKYYEHIPYIMYKLNGIPPPRLGADTEEKLRQMFDAIQIPYLRHSPPGRKNFLSYSYVLHKLLQILDKKEFLPLFSLLKSRDKLAVQEAVWRKICSDLNWPFIRSI